MAIATSNDIGGYPYCFVETPHDRFICKICHLPSRDPYLSECCGHLFCKSCLDIAKKAAAISKVCPMCRDEEFKTFCNKAIDREVRGLHIYCTNKEKGCEWQGELNGINNHLESSKGCQFEEVKCSNECGKMIKRRYLTSHVDTECPRRKVNCQYCHDTGEHQFIEGQHKEECPKLPLPCPNNCEVESVPREDIEAHRNVCQLEIVSCLNQCGEQFERQYLTTHMETECSNRIVECQHCHILQLPQHTEQCPKLPLPCPNKCEVGSVPREDMEAHRKECPLEIIQCEYHNVGCEVRMARKDREKHENDNMKEHLMMTKGELTDTKAQLAIALEQMTNLTILLYSQLNPTPNASTVDIVSVAKWSIKLNAMASMFKSGNQVLPAILQVSGYNKMKENDEQWYSDPFYTHNHGYKMCLNVEAYGCGEGTHLSVFLYLMKGSHDDELTWPLRGKFEIRLLNRISDSEHHLETMTYDDDDDDEFEYADRVTKGDKSAFGFGTDDFISNEDLQKTTPTCQYLKDDCLFFQVTKL